MSLCSVLSSARGAGYAEKEMQPLPLRSAVRGGWQLWSLSPGLLVLGSRSCGNAEGFTVTPPDPLVMDQVVDSARKRSAWRKAPTGEMTYFEVGLRREKRKVF